MRRPTKSPGAPNWSRQPESKAAEQNAIVEDGKRKVLEAQRKTEQEQGEGRYE